ncbi:MAG: hypothetical protein IIA62_06850, partial [Nitrospinae bacterium]|nr:hypothetical protein [Nitrospinota bacterium]
PKVAVSILSVLSDLDVQTAILDGDVKLLSTVPGIGKKTAERIILECRDKALKIGKTQDRKHADGGEHGDRSGPAHLRHDQFHGRWDGFSAEQFLFEAYIKMDSVYDAKTHENGYQKTGNNVQMAYQQSCQGEGIGHRQQQRENNERDRKDGPCIDEDNSGRQDGGQDG